MKIAVFSTRSYDREFLQLANRGAHELHFFETHLSLATAALCEGSQGVCAFVNDDLSGPVIDRLCDVGIKLVALRSAGYNHVDLARAKVHGLKIARVPAYSPNAVAEYTVALILSLNRKVHRAYSRVREGNFSLDGLMGFDLTGKTVGVIGLGLIGALVARIMVGFGCRVLACDPALSETDKATLTSLDQLLKESDIITLHCPLTPQTHHLIDTAALQNTKPGLLLINTSRGAVIDTRAVIASLKSRRLGGLALDVYEEEEHLFFEDLSDEIIPDDVFARLLTFPNVLITGHQAFLTKEALAAIARTTIDNITSFEATGQPRHSLT